jgi:small subunit ribosomal protein S6
MRVYEELFIVKPDAPEEEVDGFVEQIKQVISSGKGTVEKADKWGIRKLAYRIQKYNEGIYVLVQFSSSPELVREIERRMRVSDLVIKFLTVRIDEKMKKIEKRKRARDKRASRRPAPSIAAPAAPAPSPAPAMPAEAAIATIAPGLPGGRAEAARPAAAHSEPKHSESRAPEFKPEPKE